MPDPSTASTSARPADFANASPFRTRPEQQDPAGVALFIATGIALVGLIAAIIAVITMRGPML